MNFLVLSLAILLLTGCSGQQQPRHYTEVVSQTPQARTVPAPVQKPADNPHAGLNMGANLTPDARANLQKMMAEGQDPHSGIDMSAFAGGSNGPAEPSPYTWSIPKGWKQGPAKMMRLASFYKEGDPDAVDCSIVVLPGTAGGEEANIKRWMGQVGIDLSDANYQKLLGSAQTIQTQGGLQAKVYDLTALSGAAGKSMIAAMISTNGTTIFVKMTGVGQAVKQNQAQFLELLKSLAPKN
ncbi:MAG: hypothetical protein KGK03_00165 [Candidatus Omnitrophica bacterium]|nr:hypothetical protein [Candidatus Omnitrophota bacterium]MDE2221469.1 hypothetical protein [Candidatus Omnitrophota bacterium]